MKVYLGIKYHADHSNKELVERISHEIEELGHQVYCVAKDLEKWGDSSFDPQDLMMKTFYEIDESDLLLIEFSEKGVGLGIEAGYAHAKNIPIKLLARKGSDISNTMNGIIQDVIFYEKEDLSIAIRNIFPSP